MPKEKQDALDEPADDLATCQEADLKPNSTKSVKPKPLGSERSGMQTASAKEDR